jgi:acyl carrier protein
MEEVVSESYGEVLRIELVGREDDFFMLGGHSLRALRLVNLLEERTGKTLQVEHMFEAPKVSQLAALLEELEDKIYERIPKATSKKRIRKI